MEKQKTLIGSIAVRCLLFIGALVVVLSIVNYFGYRNALYERYRGYITDLLVYTASNIDVDDLKSCLETNVKSEKFEETQAFFDNMKDTCNIEYLYVIIPQNTSDYDNIMNVIAGMSTWEKENVPENVVQLGGLTADDYTAETAAKYYNAADLGDQITFLEEWADRWGVMYTGILNLYDSEGNYFAELCIDVSITEIQSVIKSHVVGNILIILIIGVLFTSFFLTWTQNSVTDPIQIIEQNVADLAKRSHNQSDPNALIIEMPPIQTKNELESLSRAIAKLSVDMRDYLLKALSARDEADAAQQKAMEMGEQATRDVLTGIRNRRAYEAEAKKLEWRIQSEGFKEFGIAMVDLNFLKRINDTFGHEKGNESIKKICLITCKTFSHSPVFRIGGDEFVVILENDDYQNVMEKAAAFRKVLEDLKADDSLEPWEQVSAAIGWSMFDPAVDKNVNNVFKRADENMYEAKKEMKAVRLD